MSTQAIWTCISKDVKQTKKVGVALVGPYIVPQECLSSDGEIILEPNLLK